MTIYGNMVGGGAMLGKSVVLTADDGTELVGVITDSEVKLTATANDVRKGKTVVTEHGLIEGEKDIPAYRTTKSQILVRSGNNYSIPLSDYDKYDYTKFQCMIAKYDSDPLKRMSVDKVAIDDCVYAVNSSDVLSNITKNINTKSIDLNIQNNTSDIYMVYFITYKEED